MPIASAMVILQGSSNLPEDIYVNTFSFSDGSTAPLGTTDANAIATDLISFYNTTHSPGTGPLAAQLSSNISRASNACTIKVYDFMDISPRVPKVTTQFTLGAAGVTTNFPNEVALCLSYNADLAPGENPKRQRGRIYVGPLTTASSSNSGGDVVPGTAIENCLIGSAEFLVARSGPEWALYSRADNLHYAITHGHVDTAYDTQRRRGRKAATRILWP